MALTLTDQLKVSGKPVDSANYIAAGKGKMADLFSTIRGSYPGHMIYVADDGVLYKVLTVDADNKNTILTYEEFGGSAKFSVLASVPADLTDYKVGSMVIVKGSGSAETGGIYVVENKFFQQQVDSDLTLQSDTAEADATDGSDSDTSDARQDLGTFEPIFMSTKVLTKVAALTSPEKFVTLMYGQNEDTMTLALMEHMKLKAVKVQNVSSVKVSYGETLQQELSLSGSFAAIDLGDADFMVVKVTRTADDTDAVVGLTLTI